MSSAQPTPTDVNSWHYFTLNGFRSPGTIPRGGMKGFKRETGWDEKKGKGTKGATLTLKSAPPVKGTITLQLIGPGGLDAFARKSTDFGDWDNFVTNALALDPAKVQAKGLNIWYPSFASIGLTAVVIAHYTAPEHAGRGLYLVHIEVIEWSPPPPVSIVSTPSGKKPDGSGSGKGAPPIDPRLLAELAVAEIDRATAQVEAALRASKVK